MLGIGRLSSSPAGGARRAIIAVPRAHLSAVTGRTMPSAAPHNSTLRSLLPYLWEFRGRAALALVLLLLANLATVTVPLVLKRIVDDFDPHRAVLVLPLALLIGYGVLRFASTLLGELRDVVFELATLRAARRVALKVFRHLHDLDLAFHLERQTGGLSRDIERGSRGVSFVMSAILFNVLPTIVQVAMVTGIFLWKFSGWFAFIILISVVLYIAFSIAITEWRTRHVRLMNELDSKANTRAIDSLLNYETVKYFTNEEFEAERYDKELARLGTGSPLKTQYSPVHAQ